jgi:hypothetical protein
VEIVIFLIIAYYKGLFVLFILVVQYIMLNIFLLILMQTFEENYINQDNPIQNYSDMTEKFLETWIEFCEKDNIYNMNYK